MIFSGQCTLWQSRARPTFNDCLNSFRCNSDIRFGEWRYIVNELHYGKFNTYRDGQQRVNATGSLSIPPNHSQGVSDETSAQQHSLTLSKIGLPPPSPPQRRSRTLMITVWYCVSVMILTQLTILRGICTDKCVMWSPSESGSVMSKYYLFIDG